MVMMFMLVQVYVIISFMEGDGDGDAHDGDGDAYIPSMPMHGIMLSCINALMFPCAHAPMPHLLVLSSSYNVMPSCSHALMLPCSLQSYGSSVWLWLSFCVWQWLKYVAMARVCGCIPLGAALLRFGHVPVAQVCGDGSIMWLWLKYVHGSNVWLHSRHF